jgi:hypothetical protein
VRKITISEDLPSDTFSLLKTLREDKRVSRAWTVEGHIKYIKAGDADNIVHRVKSIYDTVESILS